ncbi:MAG: tRNA 4-thiouridine(8) synthase ThiI [Thermoprotei archaeon]|nr:MAG: tRNA 4-thiouridine(8) synthase ThiI [Thermoprotei archaeon]
MSVMTVRENLLLVRYGEITLKSREVRSRMEAKLVRNIKVQLNLRKIYDYVIRKESGRIFIYSDEVDACSEVLRKVFGVVSFSPAIEVERDLSTIREAVLEVAENILREGMSFSIRARRSDKTIEYSSKQLEEILGADVLENISGVKVDLDNPDKTIYIEVREEHAYIFHEVVAGPGGLPYGVEGKVIGLLSGGIDSTVAAWMVMKRGCSLVPVHFDLSPFYGEDAKERALLVLKWLREWIPERRWRAYTVPLGEVHKNIDITPRYRCLLCKLLMLKVGEKIAERERGKALVTGESLGQVATQTLDNLYFLTTRVNIPVFRPVLAFDKNEIADYARRIGVAEIADRKVEACALSPKKRGYRVVTHASEKTIYAVKKALEESAYESLEKAVEYLVSKAKVFSL